MDESKINCNTSKSYLSLPKGKPFPERNKKILNSLSIISAIMTSGYHLACWNLEQQCQKM